MKKNITINLCGRLFQIDEDAYELLQQYIESLRTSFVKQEGGEEIADDIEARVAELFDELRQQGIEAITIEHVKNIITRIGRPEELAGEEDETQSNNKEGHRYDSFRSAANGFRENVRARTKGKRLYRNPNDKMLAGHRLCTAVPGLQLLLVPIVQVVPFGWLLLLRQPEFHHLLYRAGHCYA